MELQKHLELIREKVDEIEMPIRLELADVAINHGMPVMTNVAINIGTTMCAIALIAIEDDNARETLMNAIMETLKAKIKEGDACVEAEMAIRGAKRSVQ